METEPGQVADPSGADPVGADPDASAADPGAPAATPEQPPSPEGQADDGPFRLEDVPDEVRPHAERLQAQFKAALTRARQEDRAPLAEAKEALELHRRLNGDDQDDALAALNELAEKLGFEPNGEPQPQVQPTEAELDKLPPEVRERLEQVEELRAAEEKRRNQERVRILREHVKDGLKPLAAEDGTIDENRERLATLASLAVKNEQTQLPDVAQAVELVQAIEAAAVQRFIDGQRNKPPAPDPEGSGGVSKPDTSSERSTLEAMEKIADRHFVSS